MMDTIFTSYRNFLSVIEGFDSGMVFLNSERKIKKGDRIVTVASEDGVTNIAAFIASGKYAPNYMARRVFSSKSNPYAKKPVPRSTLPAYMGLPLKKVYNLPLDLKMVEGGKVLNADKPKILKALGM